MGIKIKKSHLLNSALAFFASVAMFGFGFETHADSPSLSTRVKEIANMYGAIHDYYYEDTASDPVRRQMADAMWPCFSFEGELSPNTKGVEIDGTNCPVDYTRAMQNDNTAGTVHYDRGAVADPNQFTVRHFDGRIQVETKQEGGNEITIHRIHTSYKFSSSEIVEFQVVNTVALKADQSTANRVTEYSITGSATTETLRLKYKVSSDQSQSKSVCEKNGAEVPCGEWLGTFGPISLMPSW